MSRKKDTFQLADDLGGDDFLSYLKSKDLRTCNMDSGQIKKQFKKFKRDK